MQITTWSDSGVGIAVSNRRRTICLDAVPAAHHAGYSERNRKGWRVMQLPGGWRLRFTNFAKASGQS